MKIFTSALTLCLSSVIVFAATKPPGPGSALRFDGVGSKVAIDSVDSIKGAFTVELWIKPDEVAGLRGILGSRSPNDYGFDIHAGDGKLIHADIGNGSGWATTAANGAYPYTAGSWIYLAYVVTPTNYTVYADGKPIGSGSYNGTEPVLRDARHSLFLGWSGFANEFFKGEMAEVRIWNVALPARRIASIWNRSVAVSQANLVACYRFGEGAGTIVHDSTGNGNHATLLNGPQWVLADSTAPTIASTGEIALREVRYDGRLTDDAARFTVDLVADATGKGESSIKLFDGDVAILPVKLPDALKIARTDNGYVLIVTRPGQYRFKLDLVAKIQRAEPWNQVSFTGPAAAIASVAAQAGGAGMEVQLLSGTVLESVKTNGIARVKGFLGADQNVALRWQGKITEVTRKALLTVDSTLHAQVAPAVIKYTSQFHYEIVQGNAVQLTLALPAAQALTRLAGEQIRDWHTAVEGDRQILTIEFIKPIEHAYDLTLYSEQALESVPATGASAALNPPQPLEVERESGSLTLATEDTVAEIESLAGLRQINATDQALAAFRFNGRPFTVALKLKRIEPVIRVADRVSTRLEEARLVVTHGLTLNVEKAGIYALELTAPAGFAVADVHGEGVEDWKLSDGPGSPGTNGKVLRVNFSARVLGTRRLDVQLEQPLKNFPNQITVSPLRVSGAVKEMALIGAASAPGIRLKTAELSGLREIPVRSLQAGTPPPAGPEPKNTDELLAYAAEQSDWKLTLASERLAARIVAEVFNLITIGDGIVGGSATIRYGLVNQGVQEFRVKLPAGWKNVEFTGPNIRRKELTARSADADTNYVVWTIGLQDKAWGGYTLVVTYDYQFNPAGATLAVGGAHTLDSERETGSVAVTTAANLQLNARAATDALRPLDESELSGADRALITRAVVLAYQYTGDRYDLALEVTHYPEDGLLEAVADRTQITSVLTEAGEMLTQASFMVKNNQKQFQAFILPKNATLWGCYVNGQPVKPEQNGEQVLVSLPRDANRDQAFAVDIMYAENKGALVASLFAKSVDLSAPRTDVPNTYAEWQLFVPPSLRLSSFGGTMNVAQGTTYELLDAWEKFLAFYGQVLREAGSAIGVIGVLAFLVIALVISAVRRGWNGILTVLAVVAILAVLGAMLLPALAKAKSRALRISSVNNLRQIGLAARVFSGDNGDRLPVSFEEMKNELNTDKITYDAATGQRFTYIGAGLSLNEITPDSVIAYGPVVNLLCNVLRADGSVETVSADKFYEMNQRGLIQRTGLQQVAAQQRLAVMNSQFSSAQPNPAPTPEPAAAPKIRTLRIELPQTGQPFLFTKALNVRNEPLSIHTRVMTLHAFQTLQMSWQAAAFVLGLFVWWWQWRRMNRNTFVLTLALALIVGSVCSLLIQWRALHDALIVGFPVVTLAVIAWLVWKYWPRGRQPEPATAPSPEPPPVVHLPPLTAAIALALTLSLFSASAAGRRSPIDNVDNVDNVSILYAQYTGTVNDRVALLEATLQFSPTRASQTIPLFGDDVAVQQFTVKKGDARLVRDGNQVAVRLGNRGDAVVQLKMLVKIAGDVTRRHLTFNIPPALSSQVTLSLDQPEADVDFPTAISFQRALEKEKTRVDAVIGSSDHVELSWTPRVKRAAEVAATIFVQNDSLVGFGGGVASVHSVLDYQVTQGELRQARVLLPAGQRLLRVEGAGIRTWEIKEQNGTQVLVVDLLKGVSPAWRLAVETEKALDTLPATVRVEVPHALDVKRETGLVALRNAEELGLSVESASDLQRVDVEEFARAGLRREEPPKSSGAQTGADKTDGLFSVFRFSRPDFALRVRAEAVQPQIEAVVRNNVRVSSEQVTLSATIDYNIKRAGVFALKIALPEGYRVEHVNGRNILQTAEHSENGIRVLDVALKERTSGPYSLTLELARTFKELPNSLAIAGAHPLQTAKLTGFVAVAAEPGVAAKTESFDGLTEIPAVSLPDYSIASAMGSVLAFKFISTEPKAAPDWKLNVSTESVESWVRAEVVNTITLTEALVSGRATVRYDIANAPVKELRLRIPASVRNVEISGSNIRSKEPISASPAIAGAVNTNDSLWRIELQNKTRGSYTLTVAWEKPRAARTGALELTGVSAEGVERETGFLAIAAKRPVQVTELTAANLQRVDSSDLPDWAGRADDPVALAYHYVRPGYGLTVDPRRFGEADVLKALVDSAHFTTVVADDGQMMTEMSLSVRNNGQQFLEIELPASATNWSAFVSGQPVRPSRRDGKLLVPIQSSVADDGALTVELTYVGTSPFPRKRGQVAFDTPKFNVPLKGARWEIYLPPDYDYRNFEGTMAREIAESQSTPSSASFSILDYSRMEKANKESAKAEWKRDVSNAQRQLAGGNVREATANFNRAKGNYYNGQQTDTDVKKLEKDLQTAQASNLINAGNDFALRNNGQLGADENSPAQVPQGNVFYTNAAAEQQWVKLQQAQEIVAAKVQPLRVNLPVRGLRHSFSQVLQTDLGKPMTIRLFAVSTKAVSWPKRIGTAIGAFVVLWAMVTVLSHATRRQPQPATA